MVTHKKKKKCVCLCLSQHDDDRYFIRVNGVARKELQMYNRLLV